MEKQSLHPADGWLICYGGLLVAKTSYGAGEISSSGVQNCQHGFQRFIFSMLCAAWYSLAANMQPSVQQLKKTKLHSRMHFDKCLPAFTCTLQNQTFLFFMNNLSQKSVFFFLAYI